jgi:hypothetical protein
MPIQSRIKILQKNYVYHRLNFIVQVSLKNFLQIYFSHRYFIQVLAEDAIKAAITDYNNKQNKKN